ncbi:hypothetical protein BGX38DRAFT_1243098 [Terfezia claveryi]|nr:hypothetical protein BGX38DRAFT_1243098 [Terfezia claveryi]
MTAAVPSVSKSQSALAVRCVSSVTRVPRLSTPTFFGVSQKRNYIDEALQSGPSDDGGPLQPTETLYVGPSRVLQPFGRDQGFGYVQFADLAAATRAYINELFKDIRNCLDVRVAMDRRTGQPRGFAHADFADVESAVAAREKLLGRIFFGRALRVDYSASDRANDRAGNSEDSQQ